MSSNTENEYHFLENNIQQIDKGIKALIKSHEENKRDVFSIIVELKDQIDSLQNKVIQLNKYDSIRYENLKCSIESANKNILSNKEILKYYTLWGFVVVAFIFFLMDIRRILTRESKQKSLLIEDIHKQLDVLLCTDIRSQEELIMMCKQVLVSTSRQKNTNSACTNAVIDHSLVLKMANEITSIELNLSRMDASVKGYKQLSKAVERIKNNFLANGYEIVDMLGKNYTSGIKADVTFVTDEGLDDGVQIITKVIKPQVNYHQQMIQAAKIEVSQPE